MEMSTSELHQEVILVSAGLTASIVLAEPTIFLTGFSKQEQLERPPALIRGSLILRIIKPKKFKSISLNFAGVSRTEWPEGIPTNKSETYESNEVFSHEWRMFSAQHKSAETSSGAHSVISLDAEHPLVKGGLKGNKHSKISNTDDHEDSENVVTTPHALVNQHEAVAKGYRVFNPAEYIYNFELMLPHKLPESIKCKFGSVRWGFTLAIERQGPFKPKLTGYKEISLLRSMGPSNLEGSEPIVISRDWEDLLHYEIIIAGKAFAIGQKFNVAFGLVPLAKVKCHRIRIYITEHTEYYCNNNRIHRVEPSHKFLLLEHKSPDGSRGDLLQLGNHSGNSNLTEFEFDVKIPHTFPARRDRLRPNATTDYIKVYHWIKAVMRLSRQDLNANGDQKCYEISIDSPITLVHSKTMQVNELPEYQSVKAKRPMLEVLRPYQKFIQKDLSAGSTVSPSERAIMFARKPSIAPPPFDADERPPGLQPPKYDGKQEEVASYARRYEEYLISRAVAVTSSEVSSDSYSSAFTADHPSTGSLAPTTGTTTETATSAGPPAASTEPAEELPTEEIAEPLSSDSGSDHSDIGSGPTAHTWPDTPIDEPIETQPSANLFPVFSEIYWSENAVELLKPMVDSSQCSPAHVVQESVQEAPVCPPANILTETLDSSKSATTSNNRSPDSGTRSPVSGAEPVMPFASSTVPTSPVQFRLTPQMATSPRYPPVAEPASPGSIQPRTAVPRVPSSPRLGPLDKVYTSGGRASPRLAPKRGSISLARNPNQLQLQRIRSSAGNLMSPTSPNMISSGFLSPGVLSPGAPPMSVPGSQVPNAQGVGAQSVGGTAEYQGTAYSSASNSLTSSSAFPQDRFAERNGSSGERSMTGSIGGASIGASSVGSSGSFALGSSYGGALGSSQVGSSGAGSFNARYSAGGQSRGANKPGPLSGPMSARSPVMPFHNDQDQPLFGDRWMDRRDSMSSIASSSARYFRQSSIVSMDLSRQGEAGSRERLPSRVGEVQELREWYPLSRSNSEASVAVSVAEYQLAQQVNAPLLGDEESQMDIGLEWEHDYEDYRTEDNDRRSVGNCHVAFMSAPVPGGPKSALRRRANQERQASSQAEKPASTRSAGAGGSTNTLLKLYTDESNGLTIDPVVVMVMALGFILSVVALHLFAKFASKF